MMASTFAFRLMSNHPAPADSPPSGRRSRCASSARFRRRRCPGAPVPPAIAQLYQGSMQDRYNDPGRPMLERNAEGHPVLETTSDHQGIYFSGQGASPKGDAPFVAIMPLNAGENLTETRIWQSQENGR